MDMIAYGMNAKIISTRVKIVVVYEAEFGLVETHTRCTKCNQFSDDWAYGGQEFFLNGKSWDFTSHPFVKDEVKDECVKCWQVIAEEANRCKYHDGTYDIVDGLEIT